VESIDPRYAVSTLRSSTSTLGAGFVEAITDAMLLRIRNAQPPDVRGTAVFVPVLERPGALAIGRFGWKSQHASLESFAADAYLNEMGITSPLLAEENTSNGRDVSQYDAVSDPEDDGTSVAAFAQFIRSTKAPSRRSPSVDDRIGEEVFQRTGCALCHIPAIVTARPGSQVNGASFTVPVALGSKVIHPYSDFLLHDIGTGDGIPVLPGPEYASTANQMRTAPLWGLRTRNRLMHDGLSFTFEEAIERHRGQADEARRRFERLSAHEQNALRAFLASL
jgi:CxxC motif-containing protein (DUF1111 family)